MHINSFVQDLHALGKASAAGDEKVFLTPSGKIKQNTFFERMVGGGKNFLAKIQGKTYEMQKIGLNEAQNTVTSRLKNQLIIFSKKNLNDLEKKLLSSFAKSSVNFSLLDEDFLKNPKDKFTKKLRSFSENPGNTMQQSVENLSNFYEENSTHSAFKIKGKLFDELHEKLQSNPALEKNILQEGTIEAVNFMADNAVSLMENHKENSHNAIILTKLINHEALNDIKNPERKYEVAKTFADRYLKNADKNRVKINIPEKLNDIKEEFQISDLKKQCLKHLKKFDGAHRDDRPRLSLMMATYLVNCSNHEPSHTQMSNAADLCRNYFSYAQKFEKSFLENNFTRASADELCKKILEEPNYFSY